MVLSREVIQYVAHLARLALSPVELEKFSAQLKDVLDFIDQLQRVNIKDVSPTSHILPITNVLRGDLLKPSLPVDKVLENAPQKKSNSFVVPKVIE